MSYSRHVFRRAVEYWYLDHTGSIPPQLDLHQFLVQAKWRQGEGSEESGTTSELGPEARVALEEIDQSDHNIEVFHPDDFGLGPEDLPEPAQGNTVHQQVCSLSFLTHIYGPSTLQHSLWL